MMKTSTQLRGFCPICFREHATKGGRMVQHGYQRPEHYHQNVGECTGTGLEHFGTTAGLELAVRESDRISRYGMTLSNRRADILNGDVESLIRETRRWKDGRYVTETTIVLKGDAGWQELVAQHVWRLESDLRSLESVLSARGKMIKSWEPTPLREVTVEKRAPFMHFYTGGTWPVICAGSVMAAHRLANNATRDKAKVTCPKCLARLEKKNVK